MHTYNVLQSDTMPQFLVLLFLSFYAAAPFSIIFYNNSPKSHATLFAVLVIHYFLLTDIHHWFQKNKFYRLGEQLIEISFRFSVAYHPH